MSLILAGFATIYIVVIVVLAVIMLVAGMAILWMRRQHRLKEQKLWRIEESELHFDDPVVVLGQGACGLVTKATFRGTKVAVKQTMLAGFKQGAEQRSG